MRRCTDFVRLFLDLERPEVNEQNSWNYELCGNDTLSSLAQRRFYSSTPYLILEFHTDHVQTNNTGFRGLFKFIDRGTMQLHQSPSSIPGQEDRPLYYDFSCIVVKVAS